MRIRIAQPDDASKLLEIYSPYVIDTAITFEYEVPSVLEFRNRIERTLREYPYVVAESDDGILIGYAYAGEFHGREAYRHSCETSIYVAQESQGMGIGKELYRVLEEYLSKQNVFTLYACIAATSRRDDRNLTDSSVHFHEKLGYSLVGRHNSCGYKFDKWYDIVWMEKVIEEKPEFPEPFIPFGKL